MSDLTTTNDCIDPHATTGEPFEAHVEDQRRTLRDIIEHLGARACIYSHTQPRMRWGDFYRTYPWPHTWEISVAFLFGNASCTVSVEFFGLVEGGKVRDIQHIRPGGGHPEPTFSARRLQVRWNALRSQVCKTFWRSSTAWYDACNSVDDYGWETVRERFERWKRTRLGRDCDAAPHNKAICPALTLEPFDAKQDAKQASHPPPP